MKRQVYRWRGTIGASRWLRAALTCWSPFKRPTGNHGRRDLGLAPALPLKRHLGTCCAAAGIASPLGCGHKLNAVRGVRVALHHTRD